MGMDLVPVCPDEGAAVGGAGVRIDPGLVQNMGVRMEPVVRRDLSRSLRTVGRVAYDERRVDHVHTEVQGWIERLFVEYEGELVRRGQPLLEIYSPQLVSTQEELLLAARYRDATRESRFEDVARGGEDLFVATRRRLELWDISKRDIERLLETGEVRKNLTLYAPTKGVVTHLMVRKGMEVGSNDNLYTIADLTRVWVYADVYEYELPWVKEGQNAVIDLSYLPGRSFEGAVTYVYPFLDPKTRTARVRIELDNPELILKPDMFANVTIETETREAVLAVPEEAVIRSGVRSLAIVALGEGRFSPRQVTLGIDSGDGWIEVQDGLAEGDLVVTSGQFLIDSESRLQAAVRKMLSAEPAADAAHEGHTMPVPADAGPEPTDPHEGHAEE
jgi:Cu(I)/Ag(I) efflux system membrane fusion protein/cobalt-zinc-cadmium efflux system membrane fusion protein